MPLAARGAAVELARAEREQKVGGGEQFFRSTGVAPVIGKF